MMLLMSLLLRLERNILLILSYIIIHILPACSELLIWRFYRDHLLLNSSYGWESLLIWWLIRIKRARWPEIIMRLNTLIMRWYWLCIYQVSYYSLVHSIFITVSVNKINVKFWQFDILFIFKFTFRDICYTHIQFLSQFKISYESLSLAFQDIIVQMRIMQIR